MPGRLVVASRNPGKLVELNRVLAAAGPDVELVGLPPGEDVPETGATFEENALIKAWDAVRLTGLPAVADDSGLAVDALNGMPGILSARWAATAVYDLAAPRDARDAENVRLVLGQLDEIPEERRGGRFVCVAAAVTPAGETVVARGEMVGRIIRAPRGTGGFGYDPIFVPDDQPPGADRTSAEMSAEEKDAISHRGRAFRELAPRLRPLFEG